VSFEAAAWFPTLRLTRRKICETGPGPTAPGLVEELQDNSLLTRVAEGDQDAFASLYTRYTRLVHSIATRILRDATEAEDLVQDLFLFIQRKCGVFDSSKSSARSWIVQMTYQRAIERRRYLATRQFYTRAEFQVKVDHLVGRPTLEDDYSPEVVFGRNGLRRALEALSKDQRETLRLYFFEELRDGYVCCWCQVDRGQLIVIPHPHSRQIVRHFEYPSQAEIVGRVTGVTMRIVREKPFERA
jgi:RNA polymerase sigma factor (sigma-70 family)